MDDYLKAAVEVVTAQAKVRAMSADEITAMVAKLAADFRGVAEGAAAPSPQEPAVDPRKSIREASVVCLECGKAFKMITWKHLATHGLPRPIKGQVGPAKGDRPYGQEPRPRAPQEDAGDGAVEAPGEEGRKKTAAA